MRWFRTRQAAAAAALLAVPLSLTACSSSSKPDHTPSSATTPSTTSHSSAPSGAASTDSKPTKAEVAGGMTDYFVGKGVPRSLVNDVTTCVADKGYSQFSDATLRALRNGKVNELNPLDSGKLAKVTTNCLAAGSGGSLPSSIG